MRMNAPSGSEEIGHGSIIRLPEAEEDGSLTMRVIGKDFITGRYASFNITVSWQTWRGMEQLVRESREKVAQYEIPHE